eukprot:3320164-Rhodomonas_salina.1
MCEHHRVSLSVHADDPCACSLPTVTPPNRHTSEPAQLRTVTTPNRHPNRHNSEPSQHRTVTTRPMRLLGSNRRAGVLMTGMMITIMRRAGYL